jgi:hypothetical protein
MTFRERLDAANAKFDRKFDGMDDEWTEMYGNGAAFAHRLLDGVDDDEKPFVESVISWLERAADSENGEDEGDAPVIVKLSITVEAAGMGKTMARLEAGKKAVLLLRGLPPGMSVVALKSEVK